MLALIFGLVLLALGGDSIVKGASGLAQRCGISAFTAGLMLVAWGTSLPELFVNAWALAHGQAQLALGNAVGSNIVNIGFTLGLAALAAPLVARMRILSPLLVVLVVANLALIVLALDGAIGRVDGVMLLLAFVATVLFVREKGRNENAEVRAQVEQFAFTRTVLWLNLLRFVIAAALLCFGAKFVAAGAQQLGNAWHWSPLLMGLLPVAIGTALPEVAAAIAAARRGQGDIVLGHVIGSSVCNVLLVVGGMALLRPLALPASFVRLELPAAIVLALMLYPMLRGDFRIERREGGVLFVAFLAWVALELAMIAP